MRRWPAVALGAVLTLLATLVVLNLSLGNKQIDQPLPHRLAAGTPEFLRSSAGAMAQPWIEGNRVDTLVNGREIFPAMLSAIASAQRSITLETYIYWSGDVGRQFAEALAARSRAGVAVHVVLDWIGGRLDDAQLAHMRSAGVRIVRYNAPHWWNLHRLNNRTHRKLLVADGRVAFIGGAGIADAWAGDAGDPAHWRDTHYRIEGPVVARLQSAFTDNWLQVTGEVLQGPAYFPAIEPSGGTLAQAFTSSPGGGAESMQLMTLLAIAGATRSLDIATPYFLPDEVMVQMLVAARERGVRVRVLVPGPHIDLPPVRWASRASWGPLLDAGVELYEYQPTMIHWKLLVVDGRWTSVGSANIDDRSFAINDEANMNVADEAFARVQQDRYARDLAQSRRVTAQDWRARGLGERWRDRAAALLRSQM